MAWVRQRPRGQTPPPALRSPSAAAAAASSRFDHAPPETILHEMADAAIGAALDDVVTYAGAHVVFVLLKEPLLGSLYSRPGGAEGELQPVLHGKSRPGGGEGGGGGGGGGRGGASRGAEDGGIGGGGGGRVGRPSSDGADGAAAMARRR